MYVKLKIEGELLELLKTESELECRTCTQQALYIIKSYYKDKSVTDSSENELPVTTNDIVETKQEQKETVLDIPEDILNF